MNAPEPELGTGYGAVDNSLRNSRLERSCLAVWKLFRSLEVSIDFHLPNLPRGPLFSVQALETGRFKWVCLACS